jgi:hypothetical protein
MTFPQLSTPRFDPLRNTYIPNWGVRCKTCKFAREFGRSELTARRAMKGHLRRQPTHKIQLWCVHEEHWPEDTLQMLPNLDPDEPPF